MSALTIPQVAAKLGRSRSWFYSHLDELAKAGFPDPIPVAKTYAAAAVDAWLAANGRIARAVHQEQAEKDIDRSFGL